MKNENDSKRTLLNLLTDRPSKLRSGVRAGGLVDDIERGRWPGPMPFPEPREPEPGW